MPVAVITGASQGLGLALATALAERGWSLVLDARVPSRSPPPTPACRAGRTASYPATSPTRAPVARWPSGRRAGRRRPAREQRQHAGRQPAARVRRPRGRDLPRILEANVVAPLALVRVLLPQLRAARGRGAQPLLRRGRGGLRDLGRLRLRRRRPSTTRRRILAAEEPSARVYAVDPGDMRTAMHQDAFPGEDISDRPLPEHAVPGPAGGLVAGDHPAAGCAQPRSRRCRRDRARRRAGVRRGRRPVGQPPAGGPRPGPRRGAPGCRDPGRDPPPHARGPFPTCSPPATSSSSTPARPCPQPSTSSGTAAPGACTSRPQLDDGVVGGRAAAARRLRPGRPRRRRGAEAARRDPAPGRRAAPARPAPALAGAARCPTIDRVDYLWEHGHPIRYRYLDGDGRSRPCRTSTPTARQRRDAERRPPDHRSAPGSADGARRRGRADRAAHRGLQPGVHEPPQPERFTVPAATARLVTAPSPPAGGSSRSAPRSCAPSSARRRPAGSCPPTAGRRSSSDRTAGTGRRRAAHRTARAGGEPPPPPARRRRRALVDAAYADVTAPDAPAYLWHEFGDAMLLLP